MTPDQIIKSSHGRAVSAVALGVALIREFQDADIFRVCIWLAVATGTYTLARILPNGLPRS